MTDPVWGGVDMFSLLTGDDGPRYHWAIRMVTLLLGPPLGRSTVIRGVCELGMAIWKEVRSYEGGASRGRTTFSRVQWEVVFYGVRSSVFFFWVVVISGGTVVGVVSFGQTIWSVCGTVNSLTRLFSGTVQGRFCSTSRRLA